MASRIQGTFVCAAGDSWDGLALIFFQDEKYATDLMESNPEYSGLTAFNGGERIYIPSLEVAEENAESALANTAAPWK